MLVLTIVGVYPSRPSPNPRAAADRVEALQLGFRPFRASLVGRSGAAVQPGKAKGAVTLGELCSSLPARLRGPDFLNVDAPCNDAVAVSELPGDFLRRCAARQRAHRVALGQRPASPTGEHERIVARVDARYP